MRPKAQAAVAAALLLVPHRHILLLAAPQGLQGYNYMHGLPPTALRQVAPEVK